MPATPTVNPAAATPATGEIFFAVSLAWFMVVFGQLLPGCVCVYCYNQSSPSPGGPVAGFPTRRSTSSSTPIHEAFTINYLPDCLYEVSLSLLALTTHDLDPGTWAERLGVRTFGLSH